MRWAYGNLWRGLMQKLKKTGYYIEVVHKGGEVLYRAITYAKHYTELQSNLV